MFVGNEFKEDPSSEINPMKAFGTDESIRLKIPFCKRLSINYLV